MEDNVTEPEKKTKPVFTRWRKDKKTEIPQKEREVFGWDNVDILI